MISLTKSQEPEINFIKALISDDAYKSLLLSNGAKTLSEKEMEFMFPGDPDLNN
jgi:hypothetical protein